MVEREGEFWIDEEEGHVVLNDGEGNEERFKIEKKFTHKGYTYLLLIRAEEAEEEEEIEEVGVVRLDFDEQGNEIWVVVEDEEELSELQEIVDELYTIDTE